MQQNAEQPFAGQTIYVGIDESRTSWKIGIVVEGRSLRPFSQDPSASQLARYLRTHFPGGQYRCVYEAGYFGFSTYRALAAEGIACIVVHPADVPTMDKERVRKTDNVDAGKLARELWKGTLTGIHVPSVATQEARVLVRTRMRVVRKQTRCKNQIKALLQYSGIAVAAADGARHWSRAYIRWLEGIRLTTEEGTTSVRALIEELLFLRTQELQLTRAIRRLARSERYCAATALLRPIPGVGEITSITFLTEVGDLSRFKTERQLASFVGLVPGERSSGEVERHTGITRRRSSWLRHMLVEAAWVAIGVDPQLLGRFQVLKQRMVPAKAIVRIARTLLRRMRHVLRTGVAYAPPDGPRHK